MFVVEQRRNIVDYYRLVSTRLFLTQLLQAQYVGLLIDCYLLLTIIIHYYEPRCDWLFENN